MPTNGPPILNSSANVYDRAICFDAPVEFDSGLYEQRGQTLKELRDRLMVRLGFSAMLANPPPGMAILLNDFLRDAQDDLWTRYDMLRNERWWAWQADAGYNLYDVPIDCTKALDFRRITWAGIADNGGRKVQRWYENTYYNIGDFISAPTDDGIDYEITTAGNSGLTEPGWPGSTGVSFPVGAAVAIGRTRAPSTWSALQQGINPLWYTSDQERGMPHSFDVREYLEVFPTPDKPYVIWLRGQFGPRKFDEDADYATIDSSLLFLFALANAKAHYRHPDAANYAQRANRMINEFVGQSHGLRRYRPRVSNIGMKFPWNWPDDCPSWPHPRATWRA